MLVQTRVVSQMWCRGGAEQRAGAEVRGAAEVQQRCSRGAGAKDMQRSRCRDSAEMIVQVVIVQVQREVRQRWCRAESRSRGGADAEVV